MAKTKGPAALREALKRTGMTQTELERQLGVTVGTANRWLSGLKRPDLDHVMAIRDLLDVPLELWKGAGRKKPKRKAQAPADTSPAGEAGIVVAAAKRAS